MNRREFAKCIGAVAGVAAIHGFSFANEGEKKRLFGVFSGKCRLKVAV